MLLRSPVVYPLIAFVVAWMLVNSVMGVEGFSSPIHQSTEQLSNTSGNLSDIRLIPLGIVLNPTDQASSGTTAPGVEAGVELPAIRTALIRGNLAYRFQAQEAEPGSWESADSFRIQVFSSSGEGISLLATLYVSVGSADPEVIEGVIATVDLGSTTIIPDQIEVVTQRR